MGKETWLPITGYEGLYEVNNNGSIKALATKRPCGRHKSVNKREKVLKPRNHIRYLGAILSKNGVKNQVLIHRIVADVFLPNPNNYPQVNHKNGNGLDNRVENLEWVTPSENQQHAFKIGRRKDGANHPQSKILLDMATGIFYECTKDAAFVFNCSRTHIRNMLSGHRNNITQLKYA